MKTQRMSRISLVTILLFALLSAHCAQRTDTTELTTGEVLKQLATANTQAEAELAVQAVFRKAGVGEPDKEGKYEYYKLSDAQITDLAARHLDFVNTGKGAASVGALYDVSLTAADPVNSATKKFQLKFATSDSLLDTLQQQGGSALQEPEKPDNASLIAILSQGAGIPETVPRLSRETALGPVQAFLFNIWLLEKSATYPNPTQGEQGLGACETECMSTFTLAGIGCAAAVFPLASVPGAAVCAVAASAGSGACAAQCPP